MGLFSKKIYVCEKCGKEYESRFGNNGGLCDDCCLEKFSQEEKVKGYVDYAQDMLMQDYSFEDCVAIEKHRDEIFERFRLTNGISESELSEVSRNYKKISDEQIADVVNRTLNSSLTTFMGATTKGSFFLPTEYDGIIVDSKDVFAVGFTTATSLGYEDNIEKLLCVIFTNDPYVPVFPLVYEVQKGFFEVMKSKKGREGVAAFFRLTCPNLTYEVADLKDLKKVINSEATIKGNVSKDDMLKYIKNAKLGIGVFDKNKLHIFLNQESKERIHECGYLEEDLINEILCMDKRANNKFWNTQFERFA